MRITLSVIKADIGGFVGHSSVHPDLLEEANSGMQQAKDDGLVLDYHVYHVGDDLGLIMTHQQGADDTDIHTLAWEIFQSCTDVARDLKLYGAGQDLLSDAFSGNIRGMGPGFAEMEFEERPSEPVVIFAADKTEPGAWNYPLYKIFADPFNTAGLVIDPNMHDGFRFTIVDLKENTQITLSAPEQLYDMLVFLGAPGRYGVKTVHSKQSDTIAAASSTQRLNFMAGRYVGKDDPVCIVRAQSGLPAVGEVLEPFANPHLVAGWMRGSHHGPLMPVCLDECAPTRFDGPPRVVAMGFQLAEGKLIGPQDFFADAAFDQARTKSGELANYLRSLGPFEPHRLPLDEMEYTTMPEVMKRLEDQFVPVEEDGEDN